MSQLLNKNEIRQKLNDLDYLYEILNLDNNILKYGIMGYNKGLIVSYYKKTKYCICLNIDKREIWVETIKHGKHTPNIYVNYKNRIKSSLNW